MKLLFNRSWGSGSGSAGLMGGPTTPVIKHAKGKSPINGGFNRKIIDKWPIFQQAMFD